MDAEIESQFGSLDINARDASQDAPSSQFFPLEIIYYLVDDHCTPTSYYYYELTTLKIFKSLALTCRTLAKYCRPLIYQYIFLRDFGSPGIQGSIQQGPTPERFAELIRDSPDILDFVKELSIEPSLRAFQAYQYPAFDRTPGIRLSRETWTYVLSQKYTRLQKFHCEANFDWTQLPLFLQQAIRGLLQLETLAILEANFDSIPLRVLTLLPNLKRLVLHWTPSSPFTGDSVTVANNTAAKETKLEALTLRPTRFSRGDSHGAKSVLRDAMDSLPSTRLKFLELYCTVPFSAVDNLIIETSAVSLTYLHIHAAWLKGVGQGTTDGNNTNQHRKLKFSNLRSLKLLRIRIDNINSLHKALAWVSDSLDSSLSNSTTGGSGRFPFDVYFILPREYASAAGQAWLEASRQEHTWPHLRAVSSVKGFVESFHKSGVAESIPLGSLSVGYAVSGDGDDSGEDGQVCRCRYP